MERRSFFAKRHVFTYDEFGDFLSSSGSGNINTRDSLLRYHVKVGHIIRVRKGLYASVPPGMDSRNAPVDGYVLASKMVEDAVLGYHTALEIYGKAHSIHERFLFLTGDRKKIRSMNFRGNEFRGVLFPKVLRSKGQELFAVGKADRIGTSLNVTTLERTLVDVLDRPLLGGGWEEIWRSLESVQFFDIDLVVDYALLLENSTTIAKVGFYLDSHSEQLMVDENHLRRLQDHLPKKPTYLVRNRRERGIGEHLVKDWNLMIPASILKRSWEEIS